MRVRAQVGMVMNLDKCIGCTRPQRTDNGHFMLLQMASRGGAPPAPHPMVRPRERSRGRRWPRARPTMGREQAVRHGDHRRNQGT